MVTAGDGRATHESGGVGGKFPKRPFQPEINEESQKVSQEAGQNISSGVPEVSTHQGGSFASISVTIGKSEVEQILKQMTFTRSEAHRLIALVHSRTMEEESPSTATQHPTTMESLPPELLSKIFIRLLAKQLAQMRSVNKSWNALLSQPSFIKSHLDHSIHNNDQILLVFYHLSFDTDPAYTPFTTHSCRYPHLELTNFIKLPPVTPQTRFFYLQVDGSVNGLICSSYCNASVIQIWNPSLSALLTLPPYSTHPHPYRFNPFRCFIRFGFDPKTDDYKVVLLKLLVERPRNHVDEVWQVELYSMRKGSWELIAERFPSHIRMVYVTEVVSDCGHDGRLYWLGCIGKKVYPETIVAFDLGSETFHEIPLPDSSTLGFRHDGCFNIGVLGGKLCVMSRFGDSGFEVWVMDEYGVAESWIKRHVFPDFFREYYPCPLVSPLHNALLTNKDDYLVSYESNCKQGDTLCEVSCRSKTI